MLIILFGVLGHEIYAQDFQRKVGRKYYETSNHLGNVTTVVGDRRIHQAISGGATIAVADPNIITTNDYYPYGMLLEGRGGSVDYRFGFQGQEQDDEVKGGGNTVNYTYRMHDVRLGRFFAVDPISYRFPYYSSYAFSSNTPIMAVELEGLETSVRVNFSEGTVEIKKDTEGRFVITQADVDKYRLYAEDVWAAKIGAASQYTQNDITAGGRMAVYCSDCGTWAHNRGVWVKLKLPQDRQIQAQVDRETSTAGAFSQVSQTTGLVIPLSSQTVANNIASLNANINANVANRRATFIAENPNINNTAFTTNAIFITVPQNYIGNIQANVNAIATNLGIDPTDVIIQQAADNSQTIRFQVFETASGTTPQTINAVDTVP